MYKRKLIHTILCEGPSEVAYVSELSGFLDDIDAPINFIPKNIGTGHFVAAVKEYKKNKKSNPKGTISIWVDKDTYIRNDENDRENYKKKNKAIPNFLFTRFNFEDFLVMHLSEDNLEKWREICKKHDHFHNPMHSDTYEPLYIQNIFPNYKKGDMPIEINEENLKLAIERQNDPTIEFKCDFLNLIKPYIN